MASDVNEHLDTGKTAVIQFQENIPPNDMTGPVKRLTKVEKARLEALSAFGNCPLNSLVVKKENFRSKLNASAKNAASGKDTARRLTRMQKARQEANEAFKNISLGQKRKASVMESKPGMSPVRENAKKRVTRLERCKLEAQNAFGNVALGEIRGDVDTQQDQNNITVERPDVETNTSAAEHLQTSNKDVVKRSGRESLENVKKEQKKCTSKGKLNRRSTLRRRSSIMKRRRSSTKVSRLTKTQAAQLEALQSFGGQSLDNIWKSCNKVLSTCAEQTESMKTEETAMDIKKSFVSDEGVAAKDEGPMTADVNYQSVIKSDICADSLKVGMETCDVKSSCRQKTDVIDETAPSEKAVEFSSKPFCQLIDESTQVREPSDIEQCIKDPKSNEVCTSVVQVQKVSMTVSHDQSCDNHTKTSDCHMHDTAGTSQIPEQSPRQSPAQSTDMQCSRAVAVEPKPLTRVEKARLEALQGFHGQAFDQVIKSSSRKMAKYLTPVKHQGTNTEFSQTKNTPTQTDVSTYRHHFRPRNSFYTSLSDNSFCNRDALLETSKVVVLTARSLDTPSPDCSPASTSNP